MTGGAFAGGVSVEVCEGRVGEADATGAAVCMVWPKLYGSINEVATQGVCSLLVARDTAIRVRLNTSSAWRPPMRISRTSSVTSTLFGPLPSVISLPGAAE